MRERSACFLCAPASSAWLGAGLFSIITGSGCINCSGHTVSMAKKAADMRVDFFAGAAAGCTVRACLFPIDTIKTNMQRSGHGLMATLGTLLPQPSAVRRLYRGVAPAMLEVGINRGALMGVSTGIKPMLPTEMPAVAQDMTAGLMAGMIKTAALHPLDTLTCRGQVGRPQWNLLWPRPQLDALYGGIGPAFGRSAGGMAIWLSVRNALERSAPQSLESTPWLRDWLVGMASTGFTDVCTFPLDTLKKNLQADGGNVLALGRRLLDNGGLARLYRGYGPRLLMQAVNGGLWNWVYVRGQECIGPLMQRNK